MALLFLACAVCSPLRTLRQGGILLISYSCAGAFLALIFHWSVANQDLIGATRQYWSFSDPEIAVLLVELIFIVASSLLLSVWQSTQFLSRFTLLDVAFFGSYTAVKAAWYAETYLNGVQIACPYATCFSAKPAALAIACVIAAGCVRSILCDASISPGSRISRCLLCVFAVSVGIGIQWAWLKHYRGYEQWAWLADALPASVCLAFALFCVSSWGAVGSVHVDGSDGMQPPG
ncbi:MAG: hypothetical protein HYY18_02290 [Planctomycetes bacterium]|nr:hypothetical protein [Planctomycetota bacterium]